MLKIQAAEASEDRLSEIRKRKDETEPNRGCHLCW